MVLIEAMSKGIAIATFDCPTGPREAITDGVEGLLVPPDDIDALSAGLLRLIEDPDLRQRLGTAAQQRAKDFSPEVFGRRWIEALRPWTGRDAA
jgi:glycosyltransferase involved in cell wall biosynthesis